MQRFNLSAWAIAHQPLVLFMIIVLAGSGLYAYLNLGRTYEALGHPYRALACYDRALAIAPLYLPAQWAKGLLLGQLN